MPLTLSRSPAPLPPGPTIYGPVTEGLPDRNQILNIDGRLSYGPLSLSYAYPIGVLNSTVSFGNALAAPPVNPMTLGLTGQSIRNGITVLDRYLTLQYRDRFLNDRLGLDAKVYGIEFYRDIQAVSISPSILAPNGLSFSASVRSYRIGGTVDGDVTLPRNRLLFGGGESYGYRFPDIIKTVSKPMLQVYPQLAKTRITHAWGGTLAITVNRMPCFTRPGQNVLSASGYSGHGVAMATLAGKLMAEASAGQMERFDLMASLPQHRFPGGVALRWPLLITAMTWFSMRDRLGL